LIYTESSPLKKRYIRIVYPNNVKQNGLEAYFYVGLEVDVRREDKVFKLRGAYSRLRIEGPLY